MRAPRSLRFSWLDFKVGVRMLARYPGLTLVSTAAIVVAIALGTLYFEALDKWMHPRLPIADVRGRVTPNATLLQAQFLVLLQ